MRYLKLIFLLIGLGLLAYVVAETDLGAVGGRLIQLGVMGFAVVLGIYCVRFLLDTASWQLMLSSARLDGVWLYRLWKVRMVGAVFNFVLPAATMGGEPVKAVLLKKRHGIDYRESAASLVIARTTNLLALLAFAAVGLLLMLRSGALSGSFGLAAWAGLGALAAGVLGFFAVQRWRVASRLGGWLTRWRPGRPLERFLVHLQDVDDRFVGFYHHKPGRFAAALALALFNWILGMIELYYIFRFLGHPVSLAEAWIIESVVQLVRAGTFIIPANLGALEAGFVLIVGALTGQPALGLAAAVVRRARKLLWTAWGLWLGWRFSLAPSVAAADTAKPSER
ncbi:MAG: flippase-like domain-containing protein [Proteobacteria bacterium]|nr:flippase-like domain-containing protein [Pseudomonadota bacterium]